MKVSILKLAFLATSTLMFIWAFIINSLPCGGDSGCFGPWLITRLLVFTGIILLVFYFIIEIRPQNHTRIILVVGLVAVSLIIAFFKIIGL